MPLAEDRALSAAVLGSLPHADIVTLVGLITGRPAPPGFSETELGRRLRTMSPCEDFGLGACATPVLTVILTLLEPGRLPHDVQARIRFLLDGADHGPPVVYDAEPFRLLYWTRGDAAVDPATGPEIVNEPGGGPVIGPVGGTGHPTYVERVLFWLRRALAAYSCERFGMPPPSTLGRGPTEVYLMRAFPAAGSPTLLLLPSRANHDIIAAFACHEVFHAMQFTARAAHGPEGPTAGTWGGALQEGGAVFAEDLVTDRINRYLHEAGATRCNRHGLLALPEQSVDSSSYKASLLWRYLAEQLTPPGVQITPRPYVDVLNRCIEGDNRTQDVGDAVQALFAPRAFVGMRYVHGSATDVAVSECLLGNFAAACYLKDRLQAGGDGRFSLRENDAPVLWSSIYLAETPVTHVCKVALAGMAVVTADGTPVTASARLFKLGNRFFEFEIGPGVTDVELRVTCDSGLAATYTQVVQLDGNGALLDLCRSDRSQVTMYLPAGRAGTILRTVAVIMTGVRGEGLVDVSLRAVTSRPDVVVTPWNCAPGTEYEVDGSAGWPWRSPDLFAELPSSGPGWTVRPGEPASLCIRLTNRGTAPAGDTRLDLYQQPASQWTELIDSAWAVVPHSPLSAPALGPGCSETLKVAWDVPATGAGVCVRAVISTGTAPEIQRRALSLFTIAGRAH